MRANFRPTSAENKDGRTERRAEIVRRENFYQQAYCGCVSSLRDMNSRKNLTGQPAEDQSPLILNDIPQ